jgi:deazaflavin-dependent oxidoreductase (nitroreductase family)
MSGAPAVAPRLTQRFPRWFLRAPELIFRLRLSFLVPTLVMLVTTGRRTGRQRAVVLDVARRGPDGLWVIAGDGMQARWVRNLIADPRVEVWHRGTRWNGRATVGSVDPGDLAVEIYRARPTYARLIYRLIGERIRGEEDVRRLSCDNAAVWIAMEPELGSPSR